MQIDKAIEILTLKINQHVFQVDPDALDALRLSTEALKAIKAWREDWDANRFHLLPGETPTGILKDYASLINEPEP